MDNNPPISFEDLTSISKIGERIRTQDNRMTANPIFQIRAKQSARSNDWVEMSTFTHAGTQHYLWCNGHNIPRIRFDCVASMHRCYEMQAVRNFLKSGEYDALCKLVDLARELPHHDDIPGILQEIDAARDMQKEALK